MSVHLSAPVEGLTLADLYRLTDLARRADLDPATPVQIVGEGADAQLRTVATAEPEADRAGSDLSGTVGEVIGYVDELRRRFGGTP